MDEISARIPPPTAEDTVRVEAVDAQDDTAKLEPGSSTWGEQLRDRAAGIVRRWKG